MTIIPQNTRSALQWRPCTPVSTSLDHTSHGRELLLAQQKLCIGGGPKGVAVAANAQILGGLGLEAPDVQIVETGTIAHNWRRKFAKWTDRGGPSPTHKEWAAYMDWVPTESDLSVVHGEALSIDRTDDKRFQLFVAGSEALVSDAIMFTGFGGSDRKLAPECISVREIWMDRAKDIRRTDRAVFSQDVQSLISSHGIHRRLQGRVSAVTAADGAIVAEIHSSTTNSLTSAETDVVIDARGGNPLWFLDLLSFPNLSSLGLLSDRVLSGMLPRESTAGTNDLVGAL